MKRIEWNDLKNQLLKSQRFVCFEDVMEAIDSGNILDKMDHPNSSDHKGQKVFVVAIDDYAYVVPYVEDNEKIFLKTIYPSRKMTKKYLKGGKS